MPVKESKQIKQITSRLIDKWMLAIPDSLFQECVKDIELSAPNLLTELKTQYTINYYATNPYDIKDYQLQELSTKHLKDTFRKVFDIRANVKFNTYLSAGEAVARKYLILPSLLGKKYKSYNHEIEATIEDDLKHVIKQWMCGVVEFKLIERIKKTYARYERCSKANIHISDELAARLFECLPAEFLNYLKNQLEAKTDSRKDKADAEFKANRDSAIESFKERVVNNWENTIIYKLMTDAEIEELMNDCRDEIILKRSVFA
jgi:hypothetical protein